MSSNNLRTNVESSRPTGNSDFHTDMEIAPELRGSVRLSAAPAPAPAPILPTEETDETSNTKWWESILPRLEPISWTDFAKLSVTPTILAVVYLVVFTQMGLGSTAFYYLCNKFEQYAPLLATCIAALFLILYLLDFSRWKGKMGRRSRTAAWIFIFLATLLLVLFVTGDFPYAPICMFTVTLPIFLVMAKWALMEEENMQDYVSWLSGPLYFVSVCMAVIFMVWCFAIDGNEWNSQTQALHAEMSGCDAVFEGYEDCAITDSSGSEKVCFEITGNDISFPEGCAEECLKVYSSCLNSFIIWAGPLMVALSTFFLSFFCTFLRADSGEKEIVSFVKLWLFLVFALWVTASLVGAGAGVASALAAFTLASFVGSFVFLSATFTREEEQEHLTLLWERIKEKYQGWLDVIRGLVVVTTTPVMLVYTVLSAMNQFVRKLEWFPFSAKLGDDDKDDWLTRKTRKQITHYKSWDRSNVFTIAIYWGIFFMLMQVIVARFTVLFLSWLIYATKDYSLAAVTGILVGIGLTLFLLPPVPGVPIYLTFGIVVVAIGKEQGLSIIASILYCFAVSLALKLLACTLQQKLIGQTLSGYVSVRQFCGVNSHIMRSMKLVLSEPKLSVAKVAILVGGPDWPTSVLCGIMRLSLGPILFGTLPVIFLIMPTVLSGTFTYLASDPDYPWAGTASAIFVALTAVVQLGSMVVAAYHLEIVASTRGDELEIMPIDEEVKLAEEKGEKKKLMYKEVTQWKVVPFWAKSILILSLATMIFCCYMVQLFQSYCFASYQLTDTIDEQLDGDWKNMIKPPGWYAIGLFTVSCSLLGVFIKWATISSERKLRTEQFLDNPVDISLLDNNHVEVPLLEAFRDAQQQSGWATA